MYVCMYNMYTDQPMYIHTSIRPKTPQNQDTDSPTDWVLQIPLNNKK